MPLRPATPHPTAVPDRIIPDDRTGFREVVMALTTELIHVPGDEVDARVVTALGTVAGFAGADRAAVLVARPDAREVTIAHQWNAGHLAPLGATLDGALAADWLRLVPDLDEAEPVRVHQVDELRSGRTEAFHRWLVARGVAAIAIAPLDGDRRSWLATLGASCAAPWSPDTIALLRVAAHVIGGALKRKVTDRALRESEQRFRQLADAMDTVFWVASFEPFEIVYASPAYEKVWGRPRHLLLGDPRYFLEVVHPEDRDAVEQFHIRCMTEADEFEYRIVLPDGTVRWHHARSFPFRAADGTVWGIAGLTDDVTRRKFAESAAQSHQAALAHALRVGTMGELALGIAHELNQPLSAIASYAHGTIHRLAHGDVARRDLRRAAEAIAAEALRAGQIVRTLRAHVRKGDLRCRWFGLNDLVREVLPLVRRDADAASVRVRVDLHDGLPRVYVDRIQVQQVVLNLLCNGIDAIGASSAGRRELAITTRAAASGMVEVLVADSGIGLPADAPARVFDAFYTTKPNGLGLGLTICRSIVEAHGGVITAEQGATGGAIFRVALPVGRPEAG